MVDAVGIESKRSQNGVTAGSQFQCDRLAVYLTSANRLLCVEVRNRFLVFPRRASSELFQTRRTADCFFGKTLDLRFTAVFVRQGQLPAASRAGESVIVEINQHSGVSDIDMV
jgi:hypothetical protein